MTAADMAETHRTGRTADRCFDTLYRRHHRELLAYCLRRLPTEEAEDAVAEVFAVAWRRLDQIPTDDRAIAWLFGVAHRVVANHWRSRRRRHRLVTRLLGLGAAASEAPEAQVVRRYEHEALLTALARLRWSDQDLLRLAVWEKLSYAAIGNVLGISEAAVGKRISRARKRLAIELRMVRAHHPAGSPAATPEGERT